MTEIPGVAMTVSNERLDELIEIVLTNNWEEMAGTLRELRDRRASPSGVEAVEPVAWASCPGCNGTGDQGGNPSYGSCDDCGGSGRIGTLSRPADPPIPTGEAEPVAWIDPKLKAAIEALLKAVADASGTCLGVAMSTDHPNPDEVLMDTFRDLQGVVQEHRDVLAAAFTSPVPHGVAVSEDAGWREMDSAPLNGKHCILAVPEPGGFIYSVQGAFQDGQWNVVHRDNVKPLYWMPNVRLPSGWEKTATALEGGSQT